MAKTLVVIVTHNSQQSGYLVDCLRSLRASLFVEAFDLCIVDNASTDDTILTVERQWPEAVIIKNAQNEGFAVANNQGFGYAIKHDYEFVFILNHDTVVEKSFLQAAIRGIGSNPKVAAVQSKLLLFDDKSKIQHTIASQKLDTLVNTKNVLFIGQLKLRKGWDVLLRAIPFIPPDVVSRFVFITNSAYEEPDEFASLVNVLKVRSRLLFLGKVDSKILKRAYETCAVVAVPSHYEGFGLPVLEAFDMGKPVVATTIRGAREEVVPEETGLLVPTRAPDQLAAAIERFVVNPAWGERLGQAGRQRALMLYDERKIVALQVERIAHVARQRALL